jgi:hypothetical protein
MGSKQLRWSVISVVPYYSLVDTKMQKIEDDEKGKGERSRRCPSQPSIK